MARPTALLSRRQACALAVAAFGTGLAGACLPAPAVVPRGNRVVAVPTASPADEQLKPRGWHTSTIKIGGGFNALAALHFIQNLQVPGPPIPYVTSMTFYAPRELPLVTIGVYYEKGDSQAVREMLTSAAFALQPISDLDTPLRWEFGPHDEHLGELPDEQLAWFVDHRQAIVESMRLSAQGAALSKSYDCDFTSRLRPPANTPAALVIAGGTYSGLQRPSTVITQRLVFVD